MKTVKAGQLSKGRTIKRALLSFLRESVGGWDYLNHTMQKVVNIWWTESLQGRHGSPTIPVTSRALSTLSKGGMQLYRA